MYQECKIEHCTGNVRARKLCDYHYTQVRRQEKIKEGKFCQMEQCREVEYATGVCQFHYSRRRIDPAVEALINCRRTEKTVTSMLKSLRKANSI